MGQQPTHHTTASIDRIPVFQKAIYGIGSFVNQFQAAAIGQLVIVLNLGLGMNPALVGTLGAIPRFVDAITDPLVGYSSDNFRSKYGRRRPFIFFGAISAGILFAMMFQLYTGQSEGYYFWYFLILQCLFITAFTCYSIPWLALGYEMTPDYHERTRLQAWVSFFAQPAWLITPWFMKIMNNKAFFTDIVHGARVLAIVVGALIILGGILPALFNKEQFGDLAAPKKEKGYWNVLKDLWSNVVTAFQCVPFVKLCAVTFLIFNGFMLASSFTAYVVFFYVFGGQPTMDLMYQNGGTLLGWFGMASSFFTAFVAIPLTTKISTKIGKRKTFLFTMSLAIIGYILKWIGYSPEHPYLLLLAAPFLAFHLGSLFTLVCSMVADVCDYDELKNGTRREGMFSGIYWWILKLGMAGASLASGFLLNATGFQQSLGLGQAAETLFWMRICDVGIPIVTSGIAIFIIMNFEISEAKAYDIRSQIEERRKEDRRKEERRQEEERRQDERRKKA